MFRYWFRNWLDGQYDSKIPFGGRVAMMVALFVGFGLYIYLTFPHRH